MLHAAAIQENTVRSELRGSGTASSFRYAL